MGLRLAGIARNAPSALFDARYLLATLLRPRAHGLRAAPCVDILRAAREADMVRSDLSHSGEPSRFVSTVWSQLRLAAVK
mgnify:CR=1 FL=1